MDDYAIAREGLRDALEAIAQQTPRIGAKRACPDCGRPQHYTGTEYGWAHDATFDTWDCADPQTYRKPAEYEGCSWIAAIGGGA